MMAHCSLSALEIPCNDDIYFCSLHAIVSAAMHFIYLCLSNLNCIKDMPVNKNAMTRYLALDKCFGNPGRRYFIDDLVEACKEALSDFGCKVSIRQVYDDIRFMESGQGWSIPLERQKFDKRTYYFYSEKGYSINSQGLNAAEIKQVHDTLAVLGRFKGIQNMDWIEELSTRLSVITGEAVDKTKKIVEFQENPYLKGLKLFKDVFNAIRNQRVVELEYQSFKRDLPITYFFHPYFLKEYNSRWFAIGKSEGFAQYSVFALDRICKITQTNRQADHDEYDFSEHFEDVIGVSVPGGCDPERICLQIHKSSWPYIETKPIHGSQKRWREGDEGDFTGIELSVHINYELIANILYRGSAIRVVSPESLRDRIKTEAEKMLGYYQ